MSSNATRWLRFGGIAVAAMLVTAACSSSKSTGSQNSNTGSSAGSSSGSSSGAASLDVLYKGNYETPPTTSPAGAKGKHVWWISCSQAIISCSEPAAAAADAAKVLGIDFHIADSKENAGGGESIAIRTAIAAGADAILVFGGGGCEGALGALQEAKAKNILLMGVQTPCSQSGIWNVTENYSSQYNSDDALWEGYGAINADYIIAKSGGNAKIISQVGTTGALETDLQKGFSTEIANKCPGCKIVQEVKYNDGQLTPDGPWIQAFRSALVKHPDTTAVFMPWEVMMDTDGGAQAVKDAGVKATISGGQAASDGIDFLRQGKITAIPTAASRGWAGYSAIDTINRALQGQTSFPPEGVGYQLIDTSRNMPSGENYDSTIDYKAAYLKAWNNGAGTK